MSQQHRLRALDEKLFGAFARAGFADEAVYAGRLPCTAMVDRSIDVLGSEAGSQNVRRVVVTLQLAEVPEPRAGERLRLTATGEDLQLRQEVARDESRSSWEAALVAAR